MLIVAATTVTLLQTAENRIQANENSSEMKRLSQRLFEGIYKQAWKLVKDNYHNRHHLSHWNYWEHRFDGKIHTRKELTGAIENLLGSLNDEYTFLVAAEMAKQREHAIHSSNAISAHDIDDEVGYIRLDNLYSETLNAEFLRAVNSMPTISGIILDLRGNHGGFINSTAAVFELLANEGPFVSYRGYENGEETGVRMTLRAAAWEITKNGIKKTQARSYSSAANKAIVILVDNETRSAAEMLTGALRQNNRARVIGLRTFGKGLLQDVFDLSEGMVLKIASAHYFLPNGQSIHKEGIRPDITVENNGAEDSQLNLAVTMLHRHIAKVKPRKVATILPRRGAIQ